MLAIILSACLATDPNVCKDYKISLDANTDPTTCVMDAPPYFAKSTEEHPAWRIKRWRCTSASEESI